MVGIPSIQIERKPCCSASSIVAMVEAAPNHDAVMVTKMSIPPSFLPA